MSKLTLAQEADRRRTFAIIAHPDAGKTTLTEHILLAGGAVRAAGAKEVHLRSASPQILYPDFYGIDMPERSQLMAATHSMEEMRAVLEVDSLGFLSIDGLYDALGAGPRDPANPQFTDHYFTGDYPTRLLDREIEEGGRDPRGKQLSLLVTA